MKKDHETTVQELRDLVAEFRRERGWDKHNTPRNLATSIAIEAAELLEHFQWGEYSQQNKQEITDELADVLAYCMSLANELDIDVATAYRDKLDRAKKKFPVEIFNPENDNAEEYKRIKAEYRQKGKEK